VKERNTVDSNNSRGENTMNPKKNLQIGLMALALVATPLIAQVVSAQTQTTPPASANSTIVKVDYQQVYLQKLATALGTTVEKLKASLSSASSATIDEALKNQDITRQMAEAMRQRVQSRAAAGHYGLGGGLGRIGGRMMGQMGMDGRRSGQMMGQMMMGNGTVLADAAAKALGLTTEALRQQVMSGKTLTDLSKDKKVDSKVLAAAITAAVKGQLDGEVKAGRLTQAQATQMLTQFQTMSANDLNFGAFGRGFGPMNNGRGFGPMNNGRGFGPMNGGRGGNNGGKNMPGQRR
jgi:hypothetical protein